MTSNGNTPTGAGKEAHKDGRTVSGVAKGWKSVAEIAAAYPSVEIFTKEVAPK